MTEKSSKDLSLSQRMSSYTLVPSSVEDSSCTSGDIG